MKKIAIYDPESGQFSLGDVIEQHGHQAVVDISTADDPVIQRELKALMLTEMGVPQHQLYPERVLFMDGDPYPDSSGQLHIEYYLTGTEATRLYQYFQLRPTAPTPRQVMVIPGQTYAAGEFEWDEATHVITLKHPIRVSSSGEGDDYIQVFVRF